MTRIDERQGERNLLVEHFRHRLHEIIFEADTRTGRLFDILLIGGILASVVVVMLDSVSSIREGHGKLLHTAEWGFTVLFSMEYLLRLLAVRRPVRYATSFFGIIDLLAVIPTYVSLLIPGSQYLLAIRVIRIIRVFRVLKLAQYVSEAGVLMQALRASHRKISVFLVAVFTLVIILGSVMYMIEGEENGFTSIPTSIYWSVVTLTTVGYGDISPKTGVGQFLAALIMILGYSIIVIPTGFVSVEISRAAALGVSTQACPECSAEGHDRDARYCKRCGARL